MNKIKNVLNNQYVLIISSIKIIKNESRFYNCYPSV